MPAIPSALVLTRRQALNLLGVAGAASLVRGRAPSAWAAACADTVEATVGPYWVDEGLDRSDITIDPSDGSVRAGIPLALTITVRRTDASCAAAPGVQVDVWHCDAGGLYSDEAANGTVGKKFLRGYQVTDEAGAARFSTIYPGWYSGRTIHVHFRVRAFDGATTTVDFVSQLFFADTASDQVLTEAPYNTRGTRDTSNTNDGIFDASLLLTLVGNPSDGYAGSFDVDISGLPGTTDDGTCSDITSCRAAVTAALPAVATTSSRKSQRAARRLARLNHRAGAALDRASAAAGNRQQRQYQRAQAALSTLLEVATAADAAGALSVSLTTLADAVAALLALLPAA